MKTLMTALAQILSANGGKSSTRLLMLCAWALVLGVWAFANVRLTMAVVEALEAGKEAKLELVGLPETILVAILALAGLKLGQKVMGEKTKEGGGNDVAG
jgi:hypothetical protein